MAAKIIPPVLRPRWGVPGSLFYDMTSRIYDTPDKTVTQNSDALQDVANMYERTLKTDSLGRPFRFESLVASTNDMARDWALVGGPHGALFFADEQAQGRGRRGRVWQTQPGVNLTFSLILRSEFLSVDIGLITLAAGFAMFKTLRTLFPTLNIQIKWPNDILIGPRKCSGILLESSIGADRSDKFAILGIGLNVNQITFSGDLERTATSLLLETGHRHDRIGLLVAFLDELETRILQISGDKSSFLKEYEGHLAGMGSAVRLNSFDGGPAVTGKILGITEDGCMRLQTLSGVQVVYAGDVTFEDGSDDLEL